jgi:hypothetical protein
MSSFPTLKTGAVMQYPAVRESRRETTVLRFVDGAEQRYRDSGSAVHRWAIRLDQLDEDEVAAIERLFDEAGGRAGTFSFRDPWDGTLYETCSFDEDEFSGTWREEGRGETAVVVRENRS